jgi:hypothetical protein
MADNLVLNNCSIAGHAVGNRNVTSSSNHTSATAGGCDICDSSVHDSLVQSGRAWASHIDESWQVLVAGAYILSVALGIPLGLLADSSGLPQDPCSAARSPGQRRSPAGSSYLPMRTLVPWQIAWLFVVMVCGVNASTTQPSSQPTSQPSSQPSSPITSCPDGFLLHDGTCYFFADQVLYDI